MFCRKPVSRGVKSIDLRDAGNEEETPSRTGSKEQCPPREDSLKDLGGQIHAEAIAVGFSLEGAGSDIPMPKL